MQAMQIKRQILRQVGAGSIALAILLLGAQAFPLPASAATGRGCAYADAVGTSPRACQGIVADSTPVDPTALRLVLVTGAASERLETYAGGRVGLQPTER
jgi:hypothetical protein